MDLRILITDENGDTRGEAVVYQDGSDSEGAEKIIDLIFENFDTEAIT